MKQIFLSLIFVSTICASAQAKVWRLNNNAGVVADFTSVNAAVASTSVQNGDTLYFEPSTATYGDYFMTKRLVLIGTGYFLEGANGNTGLQANTTAAFFNSAQLDSAGTGSVFIGLTFGMVIGSNPNAAGTDNITITRCQLTTFGNYYGPAPYTVMNNWNVNKCYVTGSFGSHQYIFKNCSIQNNIFQSWINMEHVDCANNVVRNNVFRAAIHIYNGYLANNILSNYNDLVFTNSVLKNNLVVGQPSGFSAYQGTNNNTWNHTDAALFQGLTSNSTDGQWRLKAGSAAIDAGLTVGAVVTPDCGAYGGPDPYRLSGIPNIPTIYNLTVPASIPSGSNSMNITFSTRNNN